MSIPPLAAAIFWIGLILGVTAGFFVFVRKWAARRARGEAPSAGDLLSEFRELHARGEISDNEYGRIKENLTPQLQQEIDATGGAATVADAADALKETARQLLAGWGGESEGRGGTGGREPTGDRGLSDDREEADDREATDAEGGAAQEGCDAEPPDGGDSTEERR